MEGSSLHVAGLQLGRGCSVRPGHVELQATLHQPLEDTQALLLPKASQALFTAGRVPATWAAAAAVHPPSSSRHVLNVPPWFPVTGPGVGAAALARALGVPAVRC